MAGTKSNPDNTWGPNEYAGNRAPRRPDMSTIAQPGGYYGGSGGNTVDRNAIPKTLGILDKNASQAKPLGQSRSTGY